MVGAKEATKEIDDCISKLFNIEKFMSKPSSPVPRIIPKMLSLDALPPTAPIVKTVCLTERATRLENPKKVKDVTL